MLAISYQYNYSVVEYITIEPYNFGDYENGWPDLIGAPQYLVSDLGASLISRFDLPAAPWEGTSNANLEIFLRWGTIYTLPKETFDPPVGYNFTGPVKFGTPWRKWKTGYLCEVLGGPYGWPDRYVYRVSGIYIVPHYKELTRIATTTQCKGVTVIPALAGLGVLAMLAASSNAAAIVGRRRRKKIKQS